MIFYSARFTFLVPIVWAVILVAGTGCGGSESGDADSGAPAVTAVHEGGVHETEVTTPADGESTEAAAAEADTPASVPAEVSGNTVQFPADRSMGVVQYFDTGAQDWVKTEAKGSVTLPEGQDLTLAVSEEAVSDLSPLAQVDTSKIPAFNFDTLEIPEDQYEVFGKLQGLKTLSLDSGFFTDDLLSHVAKIKSLEKLSLEYTPITDAGVAHLVGMENLKTLNVSTTQITAASVEHFKKMPHLTYLDPQRTAIKMDEVEELRLVMPNTTIMLR